MKIQSAPQSTYHHLTAPALVLFAAMGCGEEFGDSEAREILEITPQVIGSVMDKIREDKDRIFSECTAVTPQDEIDPWKVWRKQGHREGDKASILCEDTTGDGFADHIHFVGIRQDWYMTAQGQVCTHSTQTGCGPCALNP